MKIPIIPGFDPLAFQKYLKNTGWLLIARVGSLIIKIIVNNFALSAYLGASGYGIYSYPMVIVSFFMAAAALGLDGFVTRELLAHPTKKDTLLGTAFFTRLIAGIVMIPVIYMVYLTVDHFTSVEAPLNFVLIAASVCIIQSVNIIDSYFQAQVKGKLVMQVQVLANVLSAFIKLGFILLNLQIIYFIYSLVIDALLIALGYIIVYKRSGNRISAWNVEKESAAYLLRNSWPLAFSAILVTIYMKIDQIMIESYLGSAQLGIYTTVVSLSESWYFIPVAIVTSVFPAIMNARNTDRVRYKKRLQDMYDLMIAMSLSIAIVMTFISDQIYQMIYPPDFWSGASVLKIHVWAGVFVFLGTASSQYLIAEGFTKLSLLRTTVGALINIGLNLVWIPKYGIAGAAYATLVAYAVATFFIVFVPKTRNQAVLMFNSLFLISIIKKLKK